MINPSSISWKHPACMIASANVCTKAGAFMCFLHRIPHRQEKSNTWYNHACTIHNRIVSKEKGLPIKHTRCNSCQSASPSLAYANCTWNTVVMKHNLFHFNKSTFIYFKLSFCIRLNYVIHTNTYIIHTNNTNKHACMHACVHTYIHTCMHTYVCTHVPTYVHTYIHAYIHTYIHISVWLYPDMSAIYIFLHFDNTCLWKWVNSLLPHAHSPMGVITHAVRWRHHHYNKFRNGTLCLTHLVRVNPLS